MESLQNNNDHNTTLSFADFNSNIQVDSSSEESSYEKNTTVNTFLDEHNHTLLPDTAIFSTEFRALPAKMKNNIEYFKLMNSSRLTGIFWMSGEQQLLYDKYHDVLLHDKAAPI
ncbi:unnamed protein product [Rhizophagus irregularis]|nr:unnamed protein product [Rhizophagus irregularis]